MINQKQKMKKSALIGSLLSAGLLFGAVACEKNNEFKVKDKTLLKKAETLYNSLTTIANNEYKKVKGITDDANYIKGLAAANCSTNDYMHASEFYWSMYSFALGNSLYKSLRMFLTVSLVVVLSAGQ